MINRVSIGNYKSCRHVSLDLVGPFTVLVGRNGAGKSNILQAIDWIARTATTGVFRTQPFQEFNATIDFDCDDNRYEYLISVTWGRDTRLNQGLEEKLTRIQDGSQEVLFHRQDQIVKLADRDEILKTPLSNTCLSFLVSILAADDLLLPHFGNVVRYLSSVRYYPMDESVATKRDGFEVIADTMYESWLNDFKTSGQARDDVHLKVLHLLLSDDEKLDEFKSLLGPKGLGVIEDVHVEQFSSQHQPKGKAETPSNFYYITYLPCQGGSKSKGMFPYGDLSHGTRRIIRIVLALVFDTTSVMLFEHPEDGIHSGLLKKLIGVLKSYADPLQAIVASHSSEVFNMVEPEDIRLVSMTDEGTRIRPLSGREVDIAKKFICDDGPFSDFIETLQGQ